MNNTLKLTIVVVAITLATLAANTQEVLDPGVIATQEVQQLAKSNGFRPSKRVVSAIVAASIRYNIGARELTTIGILETGLGRYVRRTKNEDGTTDYGVFQINTKNLVECREYNVKNVEGNAFCAAKLLEKLKGQRSDYLGAYHSKTPRFKQEYLHKIGKILLFQDNPRGVKYDYQNSRRARPVQYV